MIRGTMVLALLLVALTLGLEFAHTLEAGPKLNYPPELYLRLNTSLYAWFGSPLDAAIWVSAMVATGVLAWLARQRSARLLACAALGLQLVAFANYFARVEPVNGRFRALAPGQVPGDFTALRAQWEYGHALGFVLFTGAFLLLVIAHPSTPAVNSTAPTSQRGGTSVASSSRRRPR
jgi:hypothetical protein